MTKIIILTLILITFSCGKKNSSSSGPENTAPPVTAEPLPDNSAGVSLNEDSINGITTVQIPATKKYNPTIFEDGWFYSPSAFSFFLPEFLTVTSGRSGNHLAIVTIDINSGTSLKCIYLGKGSNTANEYNSVAKPYEFDFCVEKSVSVSPGNRANLKASSQNILDQSERATIEINIQRKDKITVQVNNSNKNGNLNITGSVAADFLLNN